MAEGDGVFKVYFFIWFWQLIWCLVSDDVIVGFIVGWNFYQFNVVFILFFFWSYLCVWMEIVMIIEIFKVGEIMIVL